MTTNTTTTTTTSSLTVLLYLVGINQYFVSVSLVGREAILCQCCGHVAREGGRHQGAEKQHHRRSEGDR